VNYTGQQVISLQITLEAYLCFKTKQDRRNPGSGGTTRLLLQRSCQNRVKIISALEFEQVFSNIEEKLNFRHARILN